MDLTRRGYRLAFSLAVAVCLAGCGDEDAREDDAAAAGGGSGGKVAGAPAASGGGGSSGKPSAAGKGGGGGSSGEPGAAGKSGGGGAPASGSGGAAAGSGGAAGGASACNLACGPGMHCQLVDVTCVRAPCPPQPTCVADTAAISCDPRKILCRRAPPECPQWQVPSVDGSCFGPCVPVEQCSGPSECPDSDHYTCHMSAAHCGPYV
jgi:hypothetical protein